MTRLAVDSWLWHPVLRYRRLAAAAVLAVAGGAAVQLTSAAIYRTPAAADDSRPAVTSPQSATDGDRHDASTPAAKSVPPSGGRKTAQLPHPPNPPGSSGPVTTTAIGAAIQPPAANNNVTVDFADTTASLDTMSLGGTVSGYGTAWTVNAQGQCANSQCSAMQRLGLGAYRVSIQWNNGQPVSGAGGNGSGGTAGDQLVDGIRAAGAQPVIVIGGHGGSNDMDFSDSDAASLVAHYTSGRYAGANAVTYWVVGNEPANPGNGNLSIGAYCTRFNSAAAAMRQANANIKLIGPAWPYYNLNVIRQFLQCAGNSVDVVDYHAYGQSGQDIDANIAASAAVYEQQGRDIRAAINSLVPGRANQIAQQVGEYNVSPFASSDSADQRFYSAGNTVWNAIATGSILKGGSRSFIFADQNNPLGLIFQTPSIAGLYGRTVAAPQPAYHGIGMFSGEGLFRRFGSRMVRADSADPDIVAFASDNTRNVILVNRSRTAVRSARVGLRNAGTVTTVTIWQTDPGRPFDAPVRKAVLPAGDGFVYDLPPYSVTTVLLD